MTKANTDLRGVPHEVLIVDDRADGFGAGLRDEILHRALNAVQPRTDSHVTLSVAVNTDGGEPPEWVELIPAGPQVIGRDGRAWLFEPSDCDLVVAAFLGRGADLPFDWEHATQHRAPNGLDAPAAGWIKELANREGALWGRAEWTPRARQQLQDREYRYLSPVFDYFPDTRRIARLVSAGLTNTPNLHLQALNHEETKMRSKLLIAAMIGALNLAETADDDAIATAINQLKADRDTAQAKNSEQPSLERYVPRADYDALATRAANAEQAIKDRDAADHKVAVDTAIEGALAAGKITPATADYHRASCQDAAGLERFKAFVGAAPVIGDESGLASKKADPTATALNAEELRVCEATGIDPKAFAAAKTA